MKIFYSSYKYGMHGKESIKTMSIRIVDHVYFSTVDNTAWSKEDW